MLNLIAFHSVSPGHGKSSLARALSDEIPGSQIWNFAGPARLMLTSLLSQRGFTHFEIYRYLNEIKNEPIPGMYGETGRSLLKSLASGWGRGMVNPCIWADTLEQNVATYLRDGRTVIMDDLRFQEEVPFIRREKGVIIKVTRPGAPAPPTDGHESEGNPIPYDFEYHNTRSPEEGARFLKELILTYLEICK